MFFFGYVFGAAGPFNVIYPVIELRAPPENSGAAITIATCIGTFFASISPMIGYMGFPSTLLIPCSLALLNFILVFYLQPPGKFLPDAVKVSKNVTLLKIENTSWAIN